MTTPVRAVGLAYGLQGLGYAVVVTSLPAMRERQDLGETVVSVILLGVCATAALGSVLADLLAVRVNSLRGVQLGFAVQAVALVATALAGSLPVFVAGVLAYGVGLGMIDAAENMQGVLTQRRSETPLLGRYYALYTTGAIAGAVLMAVLVSSAAGAGATLVCVAVAQAAYVGTASRVLDPARAAERPERRRGDGHHPLPGRAVTVVGLVVLAAFTVDSGVSSWSSVHLTDLGAAAALAPVGYAVYQGGVLLARLGTDAVVARIGARALMTAALAAGALGGLVVAVVPGPLPAIAGFGLGGLAVGALVPIAFGMAGSVDPGRSDEVVARVNLFNYAGAVLGAVGVGLLLDGLGALAFLLPVLVLAAALPALRRVPAVA